ncbi:MAG: MFS transporter, partial [Candidatus Hermodarchaeota archaeon]
MEKGEIEILHSKKSMASFGFGKFVNEFLNMAFGALVFFYYEGELGLSVWLTALGYIIFAIWNAVNDPFVGYLVDRPFKFTKKWGRRFPWVFIGGVPWIFCYFLLFIPPDVDPKSGAWILFLWLVVTTCLYDTFGSIFNVNFFG